MNRVYILSVLLVLLAGVLRSVYAWSSGSRGEFWLGHQNLDFLLFACVLFGFIGCLISYLVPVKKTWRFKIVGISVPFLLFIGALALPRAIRSYAEISLDRELGGPPSIARDVIQLVRDLKGGKFGAKVEYLPPGYVAYYPVLNRLGCDGARFLNDEKLLVISLNRNESISAEEEDGGWLVARVTRNGQRIWAVRLSLN